MPFKNILSTRQVIRLFSIFFGVMLIIEGTRFGSQTTSVIGTIIALFSFVWFLDESARRYKILMPYKKNQFDSKGEREIADYFRRKRVIYHLHPQIRVNKFFRVGRIRLLNPFQWQKLTPDFYLPEYDVFVEYWGMIDNEEYKEKNYRRKKEIYEANDIMFISIYPKNLANLDFNFTTKLLDALKKKEEIEVN